MASVSVKLTKKEKKILSEVLRDWLEIDGLRDNGAWDDYIEIVEKIIKQLDN